MNCWSIILDLSSKTWKVANGGKGYWSSKEGGNGLIGYIEEEEESEWTHELAYPLGRSRPCRIKSKHTTYDLGVYFEGQMLTPLC